MSCNCANIIDKIIEIRKKKNITQAKLAQLTKLTQSVIARFESKKAEPQLGTLLKILEALDCELEIIS